MRLRHLTPLLLACAALTGCNPPQSPHATPVPVSTAQPAGLNTTPLVTGQSPAGTFGTSGPDQAFEPANSLPPGAANAPPAR
jgi:hypothetical protein